MHFLSWRSCHIFVAPAGNFICLKNSAFPDIVLMEENDKENLLIPELDEDTQSQSEEANEDKRDDKVDSYNHNFKM